MLFGLNSGIGRIGKADFALGADLSTRMFLSNGQDNPRYDNDDFYPEFLSSRAEFVVLNSQSSSLGQNPDGTYVAGWNVNGRNTQKAKDIVNAFPRRMLQDLIVVPGKDGTGVPVAGAYFTKLLDHTPGTLQPLSALITDENGFIDTIRVNNLIAENVSNTNDGGGGSPGPGTQAVWTNTALTTEKVGGVNAGSSLVGQTAIQILETMLYAYQPVVISSFNISGLTSPVEIGSTIGGGVFTASWSATNSSNINANGMSINYSGNLGSGNISSNFSYSPTTRTITSPAFTTNGINNSVNFTLVADQITGTDPSASVTIRWRSKIYYGKYFNNLSSQSPITTSLLQYGSSKFIDGTNPATVNMSIGATTSGGPAYVYILLHSSMSLTTISIGDSDQTTAFELLSGTYNISNGFDISTYKIYRSYNELNGSLVLKVT